jgi:hypothetical protein
MKQWFIKHKATIKKWGWVAFAVYLVKAIIYTGIIIWASIKFTN